VRKAFVQGIRRLNWDVSKIQAMGTNSIRRFIQKGEVGELLEEFHLSPDQIDLVECVHGILQDLAPEQPDAESDKPENLPNRQWSDAAWAQTAAQRAANITVNPDQQDAASSESDPAESDRASSPANQTASSGGGSATSAAELKAAVATGEIDQGELNQRNAQQEREHKEIAQREEARLDENIDGYVDMGILSEEEAGQLKALREVDDKLKRFTGSGFPPICRLKRVAISSCAARK
jgi:hypothetical protein